MTFCHSEYLERKLLESLSSETEQSLNTGFEIVEKDEAGLVIGGLVASTSYGWLLVKILWVDESHRNEGIGLKLLQGAESKAIDLGCHSAWLDTSNPKAMQFYLNAGYVSFGELKNTISQIPKSHKRWFMKKVLT